jgi:hypothetical protein
MQQNPLHFQAEVKSRHLIRMDLNRSHWSTNSLQSEPPSGTDPKAALETLIEQIASMRT